MADNEPIKKPEKHAGGRPTKYNPEMLKQVRKLIMLGATEAKIAEYYEVNISNFRKWKVKLPEFRAVISQAKEDFNANVSGSLYHRATGYSQKAIKIIYDPKRAEQLAQIYLYELDKWEKAGADPLTKPTPPPEDAGVIKVPYKERFPPDVAAIKFYLTNRQADQWKEKNQTELTGADGGPIQSQPMDNLTYEQLYALKYGKKPDDGTAGAD